MPSQSFTSAAPSTAKHSEMPVHNKHAYEQLEVPRPSNNSSLSNTHEIEPSPRNGNLHSDNAQREASSRSSNVLEKARAAIAAAERATAAARAAAALVHTNSFGPSKLEGRSS